MKFTIPTILSASLLGIAALQGCHSKADEKGDAPIVYDDSEITNAEATPLALEDATLSMDWGYTKEILYVNDTLLLVLDDRIGENTAHLITTDKYLRGFCKLGHGKGEVLTSPDANLSVDKGAIYLFDFTSNNSLKFGVEDLLENKMANPERIKLDEKVKSQTKYGRFNFVSRMNDDNYLAFSGDESSRMVLCDNTGIVDEYRDYPKVVDVEYLPSFWGTHSKQSVSPDGKHAVVAAYIGNMFQIFDIDNGEIKLSVSKYFNEPIYAKRQDTLPSVQPCEGTYVGASDLCTGTDKFWILLGGDIDAGWPYLNHILEFDYNGNLLKNYQTDCAMTAIAINDSGEIVAFAINDTEDGYVLKKGNLPVMGAEAN